MMEQSDKIRAAFDSSESKYAVWKQGLIEYINFTFLANGIQPHYSINDVLARTCFENGMTAEEVFIQQFRTS